MRARDVFIKHPEVPKEQRTKARMPSATEKMLLLERAQYHCQFCGIPVVEKKIQAKLTKHYPTAVPWGRGNDQCHAALLAMAANYDHILPHSHGGTNTLDNLVLTCLGCNYGRNSYTLDELGLRDPRNYPPTTSKWNGLSHFQTTSS